MELKNLKGEDVAAGLGVAWNTANDAVLAEGKRVLIDDEHRFDGVRVVGTADDAKMTLYDADLTGPLAIALGFEGSGLRRLTRERCDEFVRIPMSGEVDCLNVSVAAGVCLYEAMRQRSL